MHLTASLLKQAPQPGGKLTISLNQRFIRWVLSALQSDTLHGLSCVPVAEQTVVPEGIACILASFVGEDIAHDVPEAEVPQRTSLVDQMRLDSIPVLSRLRLSPPKVVLDDALILGCCQYRNDDTAKKVIRPFALLIRVQ